MIRSFKHKGLKQFSQTGNAAKLPVKNPERIRLILLTLDAATNPQGMAVPGFKFHPLKGTRKGTYSVWVSGNWRVTFKFSGVDAIDVDIEDYH